MSFSFRSDGWVKSAQGAAVPGAQVYVCTQPANVSALPPSPLASIFSDSAGLVPITQPILTDGFGHYDFYVAPGFYTVIIGLGGVIQQVYEDQGIGVAGELSSPLVLKTNGATNVDQALLNLAQGANVTITDNGLGTITISSSGGGGGGISLETNGVANGDQTLLNLVQGANMTITDDGFGNVTFASTPATAQSLLLYDQDATLLQGGVQKAQSGQVTLDGGGSGTAVINATIYNVNTAYICVATDTTGANAVKVHMSGDTATFTGTAGHVLNYLIYPFLNLG